MKKIFFIPTAILLATMLFAGCKTTEENYSAAYEIAKQKNEAGMTSEEKETAYL